VDKFDRLMGELAKLPDVTHCKASTVVAVTPLIGATMTFIIQSFRQIQRDGDDSKSKDTVFLQYVDDAGAIRLVIPHEAIAVIIRQHDSLTAKVRKRVGKETAAARKARSEVLGFQKKAGA
jgi:hypothetical protein